MNIKFLPIGLTSSVIVGAFGCPLVAQAQFSPVQNAEQSVTIRGNNNTVNQEINQTVILRPSVFRSGRFNKSPFSRPKYKKKLKRKYKKYGRSGGRYWKKGKDYGHSKYKGWKRGWYGDDDDDYDDDD